MAAAAEHIKPVCPGCRKASAVKKDKKNGRSWYCYRCKAPIGKGEVADEQGPIAASYVDALHERLMANEDALRWLAEERLISRDVARRFRLGLDKGCITIPLEDAEGDVRNIKSVPIAGGKKKGMPKRTWYLFPRVTEQAERLYICEGELDAMALYSLGFDHVYTSSGGADVFNRSWAEALKETGAEEVILLYDVDHAGRTGARGAARKLLDAGFTADQIKNCVMPLTNTKTQKDVTDWIRLGATADEITALADTYSTFARTGPELTEIPTEAEEMTLTEASSKTQIQRWSTFDGAVIGTGADPYILPKRVALLCPQDQGRLCADCRMSTDYMRAVAPGKAFEMEVDIASDAFLALAGAPKKKMSEELHKSLGIKPSCSVIEREDLESVPVLEGRVIESIHFDAEARRTEVPAIFVDLEGEVEPNREYTMIGRAVAHPSDGRLTMVVHRVWSPMTAVENFEEDPSVFKLVRRPKTLKTRVDKILDDAARVTGIWERPDLHLIILLTYCSTLWLTYQDRRTRGWLDVAILGDTRQGKTEAAKYLREWIGLGAIHTLKKAVTRAGILGGQATVNGRSYIAWGSVPMQDTRLVFLDEIHEAQEAIASLTSARSSGVAEVHLVGGPKSIPCRVRLIGMGNPPRNLMVRDYPYGIQLVGETYGRAEDIARVDAALMLMEGEVAREAYENLDRGEPKVFTRQVAQHLVYRAWKQESRPVENIMPKAQEMANELSEIFVQDPPLLIREDLRWKLCRIAWALANLVADPEPTDEHVVYARQWLESLYSRPSSGFKAFSDLKRMRETLADEEEVWAEVFFPLTERKRNQILELLLVQPEWSAQEFSDLTANGDPMVGAHIRATLVRNRGIVREGRHYRLTPAMVEFARRRLEKTR